MIPASLLKSVVKKLTEETMLGKTAWQQSQRGLEHFKLHRGAAIFSIRLMESRVQENTIQFVVADATSNEIGSFIASEDDRRSYELLSALMFAIQLNEGSGYFEPAIDEVLKMLPESERKRWERKS